MATGSVSPKAGKIVNIPDQTVTIGTATDGGDGVSASVPFTAGSVATGGPVSYFTATSTPGSLTANGSASPITVSGLSSGTAYTFKVKAGNATGYSSAGESAASNSVTPEAPGVFESIATLSGSGVSTVTFSSIPSTYKSLQIRFTGRLATQTGGSLYNTNMRLNGDTGANYTWHGIRGTNNAAVAYGSTGNTYFDIEETMPDSTISASIFSAAIVDIHDYASTAKNKTVRAIHGTDTNTTTGRIWLSSTVWLNTSAITSITLYTNASGNFATETSFALYGVK
jgi:hypothetical protein